MRLKFLKAIASASWCYLPEEVHEVPEPDASRYIAQGLAERADPEPVLEPEPVGEPEATTLGALYERAVLPRPKGRRQ